MAIFEVENKDVKTIWNTLLVIAGIFFILVSITIAILFVTGEPDRSQPAMEFPHYPATWYVFHGVGVAGFLYFGILSLVKAREPKGKSQEERGERKWWTLGDPPAE